MLKSDADDDGCILFWYEVPPSLISDHKKFKSPMNCCIASSGDRWYSRDARDGRGAAVKVPEGMHDCFDRVSMPENPKQRQAIRSALKTFTINRPWMGLVRITHKKRPNRNAYAASHFGGLQCSTPAFDICCIKRQLSQKFMQRFQQAIDAATRQLVSFGV